MWNKKKEKFELENVCSGVEKKIWRERKIEFGSGWNFDKQQKIKKRTFKIKKKKIENILKVGKNIPENLENKNYLLKKKKLFHNHCTTSRTFYFNKNVDGFQDDVSISDNKGWSFSNNPLAVSKTWPSNPFEWNYQLKGKKYSEIVELLDKPQSKLDSTMEIYYDIDVDYGFDIDPKTLSITFDKDTLVKSFEVNVWKK